MDARDALVRDGDLGQIRVLEEAIVGLFLLDAQGDGAVDIRIIAARLGQGRLTARKHLNMATVLVLDGALAVLRASNVLDLDTRALILLTLYRQVHIDAELSILNHSLRDAKAFQKFLELTHDQFRVVGMSGLGSSDDLKERHTSAVIVNQDFITLINALRRVLLHLNSLDQNVVLIFFVVIEEEATIEHDRVVLLGDLVGLW
mmetsp:Transcript_7539/g.10692  ORF Transcript_7539/g.10692 Transcript_7539/m.10692 type:complete len:203 (-) Transcript_7539:529-1137(-)